MSMLGKHQKPLMLRFVTGETSTGGHGNLVGSKCKAPKAYGRLQMGPPGGHGCTVHSSRPQSITHSWGTTAGVPAPPRLGAPAARSVFTGRGQAVRDISFDVHPGWNTTGWQGPCQRGGGGSGSSGCSAPGLEGTLVLPVREIGGI